MHSDTAGIDRILRSLAGMRRRWDAFCWNLAFLRQVLEHRKGLILGYQVDVRQPTGKIQRHRYLWVGRGSETEIRFPNGELARFSQRGRRVRRVGQLYRPAPWPDAVA